MRLRKAREKSKKAGSVEIALGYIGQLYAIEKEAARLSLPPEGHLELRQKKTQPILDAFHLWLSKKVTQVVPKSLLGKAVGYTLNQWGRLSAFVAHPQVTLDNNLAENAIRPFIIG